MSLDAWLSLFSSCFPAMLLKGLHGLSLHGQPSLGMQVSDGDRTGLQCCRDVPGHRQSPGAQNHLGAGREQRLPTSQTTALPALQEVLLKAEMQDTPPKPARGRTSHRGCARKHLLSPLCTSHRTAASFLGCTATHARNVCAWTGLRVFKWVTNNYLRSTNRKASASEQMGICNKLWQSRVPSRAVTSSALHEAVCAP